MKFKSILFFTLLVFVAFSCRREEDFIEDNSASVNFSTDSISFDTVFTTIGSITENFVVYNPHKERIKISNIRLNGGQTSNFRINVDGEAGTNFSDIEIASEDSMYVFIEVTVDPNNILNPFVIEDFIEFTTNGNQERITLVAWGQNAIYYTPTTFNANLPDFSCLTGPNNSSGPCSDAIAPVNVTWTDSLPIVVYGYVAIDTLDKLTIEAGTNIYFHNNGGLWVYRGGQLTVNGTKENPVTFQGDRLEPIYDNIPGQWDRIWINEGAQHEINYAEIKNAFIGIQAEALFLNGNPSELGRLNIKNTKISNCSNAGILSAYYQMNAENLVISNCGSYNLAIQSFGFWNFNHCTFANYFDQGNRETPSVFIQNAYRTPTGLAVDTPNVNMSNSIVYGNKDSEFETEIINNGAINLTVSNTLLKTEQSTSNASEYINIIRNPSSPIFNDADMLDFELFEQSVARNAGDINAANLVPFDINGNDRRSDGQPDLGAFEFQ